jgi:hypothetical protein
MQNRNSDRKRSQINAFSKKPTSTMFDAQDVAKVLYDFPKIELSYETVVHKNVPFNCVALIPMGQPCFAWFTIFNEHCACFIVDTRKKTVERVLTGFDASLCAGEMGTILHGTYFYTRLGPSSKVHMFSANDIFYYKGVNVGSPAKYSTKKLSIFKQLFTKEIEQRALTPKCVVFGLPCMNTCINELLKDALLCPYKIKYVQFTTIDSERPSTFNMLYDECVELFSTKEKEKENEKEKEKEKEQVTYATQGMNAVTMLEPITSIAPALPNPRSHLLKSQTKVFTVTPDVRPDTYHLTQMGVDFGLACVPNFTCSVMMNRLFRIIKENDWLDALEESDDEEEFENPDPFKFVHLNKSVNMLCEYNRKFKKWVPVKVVQE